MKLIARHSGSDVEVEVLRHGSGYRVRIGDRWLEADFASVGRYVRSLRLGDGTQLALVHHRDGTMHEISLGEAAITIEVIDPLSARRRHRDDEAGGGGIVKALMPGRVVRLLVQPGASVTKGTALLILEAMKMENAIDAPGDGVVDQIFVEPGQTVEAGTQLVHIAEPPL